jgi:hypothetical protein
MQGGQAMNGTETEDARNFWLEAHVLAAALTGTGSEGGVKCCVQNMYSRKPH